MRQRCGQRCKAARYLTTQNIVERRRNTLVRNVLNFDTRRQAEHFSQQVVQCAVAGRCVLKGVGRSAGGFDKRFQIAIRRGTVDHQHVGNGCNQANRNKVFDGIKARRFVQRRVDRHGAVDGEQQRVTIFGRLGGKLRANVAACARFVVHHKALLAEFSHFGGHYAGYKVIGATGGLRNDEGNWLGRVGRIDNCRNCLCPRTCQRKRQCAAHQNPPFYGVAAGCIADVVITHRKPQVNSQFLISFWDAFFY